MSETLWTGLGWVAGLSGFLMIGVGVWFLRLFKRNGNDMGRFSAWIIIFGGVLNVVALFTRFMAHR